MSDDLLHETQPISRGSDPGGETIPTPAQADGAPPGTDNPPARPPRFAWVRPLLLGWLILFGVLGLSAYSGYRNGVADRIALQSTQAYEELEEQYQLGLTDFSNGDYERARQRFEYILSQDPNHARAIEMLARTLAVLQATATPTPITPTPTPTLTPTPDLRAVEELFAQARSHMQAQEWDAAISTLLTLRQRDPAYRAVDVDSMLYVAFRYRGVEKLLTRGELESGLLDLSQAELFGPLDSEAQSYANFARLFIVGVSFWEVDWGQAAYYFGQVAPFLPNMHNGDNWFASQRYIEAMQHYIDQLAAAKNWCEAETQAGILAQFSADPQLEPTQAWLERRCDNASDENGPDEQQSAPPPAEATPTPPTPTPEPTAPPTETPAP